MFEGGEIIDLYPLPAGSHVALETTNGGRSVVVLASSWSPGEHLEAVGFLSLVFASRIARVVLLALPEEWEVASRLSVRAL